MWKYGFGRIMPNSANRAFFLASIALNQFKTPTNHIPAVGEVWARFPQKFKFFIFFQICLFRESRGIPSLAVIMNSWHPCQFRRRPELQLSLAISEHFFCILHHLFKSHKEYECATKVLDMVSFSEQKLEIWWHLTLFTSCSLLRNQVNNLFINII